MTVSREFWRRTLEDMTQEDGDLDKAIALMRKHDALADTITRARHYGAIARDALGIFTDSEIKRSMVGLIDFCIDRPY